MNSTTAIANDSRDMRFADREYQFELYSGKIGLATISRDWNQITQSLEHARYFHLYGWYESYLDHLSESDSEVYFLLARQQGSPTGVIPFRRGFRKIAGLGLRSLEFPTHPHINLSDCVFAQANAKNSIIGKWAKYLRQQSNLQWDVLYFPNLLEDSSLLHALNSAPPGGYIQKRFTKCDYLPCLSVDEISSWVSKNFRGNLRKARNKLNQLRDVEYFSARRQPDIDEALSEFLKLEASGWKGEKGEQSAIIYDQRLIGFYQSLCSTFSTFGACEINLLKAEGRYLAGQFCILVGDTSYILKIGYDESYSQVAPGNMLLEHSLDRYHREGEIKYVNLVSNAKWHSNWNPLSYDVSEVYIFNTTVSGITAFILLQIKGVLRNIYHYYLNTSYKGKHIEKQGE